MLDTVLRSGEYVCCSVVFGTLIGVSMYSVIWLALLIISDISCLMCIDVLSRGGIYMFGILMSLVLLISTMTMLKFCIVCFNGRRYICCSAWYIVPNERDDPIPSHVQPIGKHGGKVMYFGSGVC